MPGVIVLNLTAKLTATGFVILPKCCPYGRQRFAELASLRESTGSSLTLFGCVLILPLCLSVVRSGLAIMTLLYVVSHGIVVLASLLFLVKLGNL